MCKTRKVELGIQETPSTLFLFIKNCHFTEHMMKERISLNFELAIETLVGFGFKPIDAQVYILLAKKGPQRGKDLANSLKITKQKLYPALRNLQKRGIVNSTHKRPAIFSAISIEEALDAMIKTKIEETQRTIENKEELLSSWRSIAHNNSET